jgi:hypothetical protein
VDAGEATTVQMLKFAAANNLNIFVIKPASVGCMISALIFNTRVKVKSVVRFISSDERTTNITSCILLPFSVFTYTFISNSLAKRK